MLAVLQSVSSAQEVVAKVGEIFRSGVVQADNEKGSVDDVEASPIRAVTGEHLPKTRPGLAVLGGKDAERVACSLGLIHVISVGDDAIEVAADFALGEEGTILIVKDVEPICEKMSQKKGQKGSSDLQNCPRLSTTMCLESGELSILHPR